MKKLKTIFLLLGMTLLLSGCVKYDAKMDIKKNKSMDFSITYAVDTTYFGETSAIKEEEKAKLEQSGFVLKEYAEGSMKGFTITKNYSNIDKNATSEDVVFDLSGMLKDANDTKIFKVKKSFLKNTYTAKFTFDTSESDLNTVEPEEDDEELDETDLDAYMSTNNLVAVADENETPLLTAPVDNDLSITTTGEEDLNEDNEEDTTDNDSDFDLSGLTGNMDLKFSVNLPYAAKSNNATAVNNDKTSLSWDLVSGQTNTIEFEFELYNLNNIYIVVAAGLVLLIVIIATISKGKKKNLTPIEVPVETNNVETTVQPSTVNETTPVETVEETNKQEIIFVNENKETPIVNQEPEMNIVNENINSDPRITFNNISVSSTPNNEEVKSDNTNM